MLDNLHPLWTKSTVRLSRLPLPPGKLIAVFFAVYFSSVLAWTRVHKQHYCAWSQNVSFVESRVFEMLWDQKLDKHNRKVEDQERVLQTVSVDSVREVSTYDVFEPVIDCYDEVRLGLRAHSVGDGPKFVCGAEMLRQELNCVVYSIGSNRDFTFEEAVIKAAPNCAVHTFDGTVNLTEEPLPRLPNGIKFHNFNVAADCTTELEQEYPTKCVENILHELNHHGQRVTWLKIDCEGCEYDVIPKILDRIHVDQVLIEVHGVDAQSVRSLFRKFSDSGLYVFHKERNGWGCGGFRCVEFSLMTKRYAKSVLAGSIRRS